MRATFWIWWADSPMRITLDSGDKLELSTACKSTEEGWTQESVEYHNDGERIVVSVHLSGRDCDGRLNYFSSRDCLITNLPRLAGNRPVYPHWENVKRSQRDHTAEAAGY